MVESRQSNTAEYLHRQGPLQEPLRGKHGAKLEVHDREALKPGMPNGILAIDTKKSPHRNPTLEVTTSRERQSTKITQTSDGIDSLKDMRRFHPGAHEISITHLTQEQEKRLEAVGIPVDSGKIFIMGDASIGKKPDGTPLTLEEVEALPLKAFKIRIITTQPARPEYGNAISTFGLETNDGRGLLNVPIETGDPNHPLDRIGILYPAELIRELKQATKDRMIAARRPHVQTLSSEQPYVAQPGEHLEPGDPEWLLRIILANNDPVTPGSLNIETTPPTALTPEITIPPVIPTLSRTEARRTQPITGQQEAAAPTEEQAPRQPDEAQVIPQTIQTPPEANQNNTRRGLLDRMRNKWVKAALIATTGTLITCGSGEALLFALTHHNQNESTSSLVITPTPTTGTGEKQKNPDFSNATLSPDALKNIGNQPYIVESVIATWNATHTNRTPLAIGDKSDASSLNFILNSDGGQMFIAQLLYYMNNESGGHLLGNSYDAARKFMLEHPNWGKSYESLTQEQQAQFNNNEAILLALQGSDPNHYTIDLSTGKETTTKGYAKPWITFNQKDKTIFITPDYVDTIGHEGSTYDVESFLKAFGIYDPAMNVYVIKGANDMYKFLLFQRTLQQRNGDNDLGSGYDFSGLPMPQKPKRSYVERLLGRSGDIFGKGRGGIKQNRVRK